MRQYIGARYTTKIYENSLDPSSAEWQANVNYEPITLVTYNNGSYLSKKDIPANIGDPASNPSYWVQTGFYNGQIAYLQKQIDQIKGAFVTPEMFSAKGDGVTDDTAALQAALDTRLPLVIPSKTYLISEVLHVYNDIYSAGEIIYTAESQSGYVDNSIIQTESDDIIISGGTYNGNYTGSSAPEYSAGIRILNSNITVENCIIKNCHGDGVEQTALKSENVIIKNNIITDCYRHSISVMWVDNVVIEGNVLTIDSAYGSTIDVETWHDGISINTDISNVNIVNNVIISDTKAIGIFNENNVSKINNVTIDNNYIEATSVGITHNGYGTSDDLFVVSNCTIKAPDAISMLLAAVSCKIVNNTITGDVDIIGTNTTYSGNTVTGHTSEQGNRFICSDNIFDTDGVMTEFIVTNSNYVMFVNNFIIGDIEVIKNTFTGAAFVITNNIWYTSTAHYWISSAVVFIITLDNNNAPSVTSLCDSSTANNMIPATDKQASTLTFSNTQHPLVNISGFAKYIDIPIGHAFSAVINNITTIEIFDGSWTAVSVTSTAVVNNTLRLFITTGALTNPLYMARLTGSITVY